MQHTEKWTWLFFRSDLVSFINIYSRWWHRKSLICTWPAYIMSICSLLWPHPPYLPPPSDPPHLLRKLFTLTAPPNTVPFQSYWGHHAISSTGLLNDHVTCPAETACFSAAHAQGSRSPAHLTMLDKNFLYFSSQGSEHCGKSDRTCACLVH